MLLGGAAGGFVRRRRARHPAHLRGHPGGGYDPRLGRGAGLDETVPLPRILLRIAEFFRDESCGQCVPCRVGTVRQEEALHRIADAPAARRRPTTSRCSREVGAAMRDASICGLGQTAWNAVESAIDRLGAYE